MAAPFTCSGTFSCWRTSGDRSATASPSLAALLAAPLLASSGASLWNSPTVTSRLRLAVAQNAQLDRCSRSGFAHRNLQRAAVDRSSCRSVRAARRRSSAGAAGGRVGRHLADDCAGGVGQVEEAALSGVTSFMLMPR
jgi:hypothetical protein